MKQQEQLNIKRIRERLNHQPCIGSTFMVSFNSYLKDNKWIDMMLPACNLDTEQGRDIFFSTLKQVQANGGTMVMLRYKRPHNGTMKKPILSAYAMPRFEINDLITKTPGQNG